MNSMFLRTLVGTLCILQSGPGTPVEYTDCQFTVPSGYAELELERGTGSHWYSRRVTEPVHAEIELGIHIAYSAPMSPGATLMPEDVARMLGLPPGARVKVLHEPWRKADVPGAEYWFDRISQPFFGMCVFLPIEGKIFLLEIKAPASLEGEACGDLRKVAASATGSSAWSKAGTGSSPLPSMLGLVGSFLILVGLFWSANSVYKSGERGLGCLFLLFAPASVVYGLFHLDEQRTPCLIQCAGYLCYFVALALYKSGV